MMDGSDGHSVGGASSEARDSITINDLQLPQQDIKPLPTYVREINKFANVVISSATVSLIRSLVNRPAAPSPPPDNLPPWFASEYANRASWQAFLKQYGKDTVILTGAAYLMDGVEYAVKTVRGTDKDPANKMIGGVAAGGMLGMLWYPSNATGRAVMTAAGAMVGLLTFSFEKTAKVVLFEQQKQLEKDLLHKRDEDVRPALDPPYLRQLLRIKQQQLLAEHGQQQQKLKEQHQRQMQGRSAGVPHAETGEELRSWQGPSSASDSTAGGTASSSWSTAGNQAASRGFATQGSSSAASAGAKDEGDVLLIDEGGARASSRAPGDGRGMGSKLPGWQPGGGAASGKKWDSKQQGGDAGWLVINEERDQ